MGKRPNPRTFMQGLERSIRRRVKADSRLAYWRKFDRPPESHLPLETYDTICFGQASQPSKQVISSRSLRVWVEGERVVSTFDLEFLSLFDGKKLREHHELGEGSGAAFRFIDNLAERLSLLSRATAPL